MTLHHKLIDSIEINDEYFNLSPYIFNRVNKLDYAISILNLAYNKKASNIISHIKNYIFDHFNIPELITFAFTFDSIALYTIIFDIDQLDDNTIYTHLFLINQHCSDGIYRYIMNNIPDSQRSKILCSNKYTAIFT
jgi:hypothetical protein